MNLNECGKICRTGKTQKCPKLLKYVSIEGHFKNIWKVYFWAVGTIVGEQLTSFLLLNLGMKVKQTSSGCFF